MIPPAPRAAAGPGADTLAGTLARGVPAAYAAVFFSPSRKLGWWLIAVTLLVPRMGLTGLAGAGLAGALGWWLGFDRTQLRQGYLLFNPLLACLTVAWLDSGYHFPPGTFVALWFGAALGALLLSAGLHAGFGLHLGLSSHSLAAVLVSYVLFLLGTARDGPFDMTAAAPPALVTLDFLPAPLRVLGQGFGTMLFLPFALPGLLVLLGVAVDSPLTAVVAGAGLAAGTGGFALLSVPLDAGPLLWGGFNFLLCGIALGVGYYTPSRSSLLLALAAAFLCAPVIVALATALRTFDLPASALPANLVILTLVYALRQRRDAGALLPNLHPARGPELNARLHLLNAARFPFLATPALRLPCDGPRLVTQGFDGAQTHRGLWRHALDFEAREAGRAFSGEGANLAQFHTYGTPVLAPCDGVVVRVVQEVADNAPGQNNPDANWGNFVLLLSDAGGHVMLAHLQPGSVTVAPGARVATGARLGAVGNSGRSPVPHLHLQLQASPLPGAPTLAFCLTHYLEQRPDSPLVRYHTAGIPAVGTTIRPPAPDLRLADGLGGWLPGEYCYRLTSELGHSWEETVLLDFDDDGCFRFRSRRHRASLRAFIKGQAFYCADFDGPGASVLALLSTALARVPCIAEPAALWSDRISAIPFAPAATRWLHSTLDPFLGPSLMEYRYRFGEGPGTVIECELASSDPGDGGGLPRRLRTQLLPWQGFSALEVRFADDRGLKVEQTGYRAVPR